MELHVTILGDAAERELRSLRAWLDGESQLHGKVQYLLAAPQDTELGSMLDTLAIVIGSSGTTALFARVLTTWIRSRRSDITIKIKAADKTIEIRSQSVSDPLHLLKEILKDEQQ
ncbi:hypothetical protein FE391_18680 [Nonomuraea sp. KC401]|uniref:effector-associated constant component EACC1 n=1 Tax=unclassified Nonomuraea TaxID=2593643 RepID=UPI0010FD84CD|nr:MULTISPECIES: hypothetical protein [unclassified Nonomuraea]NBE95089.1 hypothetical protein [Nonomuraea sp. K271]TLF71704.1 hypothetical protein FE391_18680 [Nonomuraea sp. KC401]